MSELFQNVIGVRFFETQCSSLVNEFIRITQCAAKTISALRNNMPEPDPSGLLYTHGKINGKSMQQLLLRRKVFQSEATRSSRDRKSCDKRNLVSDTESRSSAGNRSLSGSGRRYRQQNFNL